MIIVTGQAADWAGGGRTPDFLGQEVLSLS